MKSTLVRAGLVALMVGAVAGCGGGGGGGGGAAAPATPAGPTLTQAPVPTGNTTVDVTTLTADQLAALQPQIVFGTAIVGSPPQVSFAVQDANGNPIIGLGNARQGTKCANGSGNYTVDAQLANLSFSIAKLVPGTDGAPSKWVSYIVTTAPQKNKNTGADVAVTPSRPSTDNTGTLTDNGNGTYVYKFSRDITKIKDDVAGMTVSAPNDTADLGDLTYDANSVHRLTIQLSGTQWGTGTYTADCSDSGNVAVTMTHPFDGIYDFVPATGKAAAATDPSRDIVASAKCNECHRKLGGIPGDTSSDSGAAFHGGNRNETRYCVVCHTEQRKYGRTEATIDASLAFTSTTYKVDGRAVGNLPNHIHKIHMGEFLAKKNYNYADVLYNEVLFPQDIRNCTKCHDGSDTSTAKTANGNNWKEVPNRLACGACHDGINFATGKGVTLADAAQGLTTSQYGHIGGSQADDSKCALCHGPAAIDVYHLPVTPPSPTNALLLGQTNNNTNAAWIASNSSRLPEGAIKVTYDIKSVSVDSGNHPVMVFRLLQNGARKDLNVYDNTTANPATGRREIWPDFMGAPSVYFVFSVPQDGITAPADFNASVSAYLRCLWNGTATVPDPDSCVSGGTLTGPDADGYYTATFTATIPASAAMLTGGLGYSYNVKTTLPLTQTNLADYPTAPATADPATLTAGMPNATGGLIVIAPNAQMVATGFTGRRAIVEDARCNKCHQELGTFTDDAFHAGQRNDGTTCSWCHTPNRTSSGWSADSTYYIHAIHAGAKRAVPFNWHAAAPGESFAEVKFPGILKECETCHLPGTYDFSASASASALPNRLYRTVATGTLKSTGSTYTYSPYITQDVNYGSGFSYNVNTGVTTPAAGTTLVISPIATPCSACHDSDLALAHMKSNGGSFYTDRTTALGTAEQCTLCHLSGKVADIKAMHAK